MLLSTILPLLPFILAQVRAQHAPHPFQLEEREHVQLDERGLPITATTTMWHMVTMTETVWVQPTDQAVFAPVPPTSTVSSSLAETTSSSHSGSASSTPHEAHSSTSSAGPSPTSVVETSSHPTASHSSSDHTLIPSPSSTEQQVVVESAAASPHASSAHSSSHSSSHSTSHASTVEPTATSHSSTHSSLSHTSSASQAVAESSVLPSTPSTSSSHSSSSPQSSASHSSSSSHSAASASPTASPSSSSTELRTSSSTIHSNSSSHSATHTESSLIIEAVSTSSALPVTSSSTSASASPSPSSGLPPVPSRIMAGYYPDWSSWYLAPEKVDFSKFDILDFAFAIPTESGGLEFTQNESSDLLHRLVKVAHSHGKRVKLSIGGWTGSKFFSPISADARLRKVFVKSMTDAYATYNLDGIDIDWEYPGAGGAAGNIVSPQDSANYLLMLQELRAALPAGALITLATQVWPFTGSNGSPLSNVRGFAAVIDWILIMNYDIWGSSSTPGPNAPLSDACGNSTQPLANAYASVSSWTQAGLDPSQITIGVPAYGYLQQSWATSLRQRDIPEPANSTVRQRRGMQKRFTTVSSGWSTTEGQVMWHDLVSQGALHKQWDGQWVGAGGFSRVWDECSSTPFLKSTQSGQIVTYDDPQSMSLKGQFAAQAGLRGCNVFSVDGDWTNGEWPLTDAVRSGLGL